MLASVQPSGRTTTDVMFVRSTDDGSTFSAPHKVNDDPVNPSKWHWFGTFSVAPNGRLDAVWYDTRNAANNTDSQLFYSFSTDAGVTWSPNVAVSNAFNPFEGYPNQSKIGDYITIVSDNTGGNVAYSATFNFNPKQEPTRRRRVLRAGISNGRRHTDADTYRLAHTYACTAHSLQLLPRQQLQQQLPHPGQHRRQGLSRRREPVPHPRPRP